MRLEQGNTVQMEGNVFRGNEGGSLFVGTNNKIDIKGNRFIANRGERDIDIDRQNQVNITHTLFNGYRSRVDAVSVDQENTVRIENVTLNGSINNRWISLNHNNSLSVSSLSCSSSSLSSVV